MPYNWPKYDIFIDGKSKGNALVYKRRRLYRDSSAGVKRSKSELLLLLEWKTVLWPSKFLEFLRFLSQRPTTSFFPLLLPSTAPMGAPSPIRPPPDLLVTSASISEYQWNNIITIYFSERINISCFLSVWSCFEASQTWLQQDLLNLSVLLLCRPISQLIWRFLTMYNKCKQYSIWKKVYVIKCKLSINT